MPPHQQPQWSGRPCNFTTRRRRQDGDRCLKSELQERRERLLPRRRQGARTGSTRRENGVGRREDGDSMEQDDWPLWLAVLGLVRRRDVLGEEVGAVRWRRPNAEVRGKI